jgi:GntR family transcriptional regulator, arabinose operon transcriptional repressor
MEDFLIDRKINKALYKQIYENLKKDIVEGTYKGSGLLPSERELCDKYGVDRITVRKSLELLVKDGLVEKKAGLGTIVKDFPLRAAIQSDSKNILFILPKSLNSADRITESFNSSLFYRIEDECRSCGYSLIYSTAGNEDNYARISNGNSISGLMLVSKVNEKFLEEIKRIQIPAVVVNNFFKGFTSIVADNEKGAYEATKYLNELGHERIGIILGTDGYLTSAERFDGYKKALGELNIDWQGQSIREGQWTFDSGFKAMKEILKGTSQRPTAILASNDITAIGAIEAAKEEGYFTPEDISIIGFDNIEQCDYVRPKLTSVAVDINLMAKVACQQLFHQIETGVSLDMKIVTPVKLVLRESTMKFKPSKRNLGYLPEC